MKNPRQRDEIEKHKLRIMRGANTVASSTGKERMYQRSPPPITLPRLKCLESALSTDRLTVLAQVDEV
jgi:hypothetical protein